MDAHRIRVAIIASAPLVRDGLAATIGADARSLVVSVAPNASQLRFADSARPMPDVVVAELSPGEDLAPLNALFDAGMGLVVLADPRHASRVLERGATFLRRDAQPNEIAAAIEAAAAGLVAAPAGAFGDLLGHAKRAPSPRIEPLEPIEPLTPRELQVLHLLAGGLANRAIAARLAISEHTAKFHVARILDKLDATTRTAAVAIGLRDGLIGDA